MEWIKTKDRLPDINEFVLCCSSNRNDSYRFFVAAICDSQDNYWKGPVDFDILIEKNEVTHWMEIPKLPENDGS
jgi:hypothetical protein